MSQTRVPLLTSNRVLLALLCGIVAGCGGSDELRIPVFEDVTASSGLPPRVGTTYGAAWGDFDADGRPDLYVTNHLQGARLFRNLGHGRFAEVTAQWFSASDLGGDKHGAAWADFDNDGRLDLVQLMGAERGLGSEAKRLFINRGTRFEDVAEAAGVSNPFSRTRMPLWVDLDRDGRLDLFHGAEARFDERPAPFIFLQRAGKFEASGEIAAFGSPSAPFCIVTQLTGSASADLVCRVVQKGRTAQIFNTGQAPMKELAALPATAFEDVAAGDFDNDGRIDLFLARKNPAAAVSIARPDARELIADTWIDPGNAAKPIGFSFRTPGELALRVAPGFPPGRIFIGASGAHPEGLEFRLSRDAAAGVPPAAAPDQGALYISRASPDRWQMLITGPGKAKHQQVVVKVTSSEPLSDIALVGDDAKPEEAPARLFMNRDGKLVEEGDKRGVNSRIVSAVNVVAADFDNDMHLDLFVLVSGEIGKQENLLLRNRGDGRFAVVRGAGGAAGGRRGVGDSVTTVDFDGDGFMDLFIATGGSMGRSLGLPSERGGYQLYRNVGNGNHWLEIDLEGSKSNRDAIGARVELTAGGVTQVRIQDGGVHHRGQNHMRLHFGLAKQLRAETIRVYWPSGAVQELVNVEANRLIRVREP